MMKPVYREKSWPGKSRPVLKTVSLPSPWRERTRERVTRGSLEAKTEVSKMKCKLGTSIFLTDSCHSLVYRLGMIDDTPKARS